MDGTIRDREEPAGSQAILLVFDLVQRVFLQEICRIECRRVFAIQRASMWRYWLPITLDAGVLFGNAWVLKWLCLL